MPSSLTLSIGAIGTAMSGVIFMPGLATGSLVVAAAMLAVIMFVMGMTSGPLGGWLSSLFPVRVRYSGVSLAFALGGIIGGAFTPIAAQWLSASGAGHLVGALLTAAGLASFIGVRLGRPSRSETFARYR